MTKVFVSRGCLKRWVTSLMMSVFIGSIGMPVWAGDPLLDKLPDQTLLCVRMNGLDQTLGKLDQFLMGLAPINISMMAKMQLGNMLGNPQLSGLNTQGPIALVALSGQGSPLPNFGVLVPVNDYTNFATSCTNLQAQADGIYAFGQGSTQLLMIEAGNHALLAPQVDAIQLQALKQRLSGGTTSLGSVLDASHAAQATNQPLWIFVNTSTVAKTYGPMLQGALQQAQGLMGAMAAAQGNAAANDPAVAAATQEVGKKFIDVLAQQTRYATISLNPEVDKLGINAKLVSVPDTDLAKKLTRDGAARDTGMMTYLQDGAVLNVTGQLMSKLMDTKMSALASACPMQDEATKVKVQALMTDMISQFKGSDALSVKLTPQSKPFFSVQYAAQVRDGKALQGKIQELIQLLAKEVPSEKMTLSSSSSVSTHKGVSIDSAKWTATQSPGPINELEYRMACVDKVFVMAVGSDIEPGIQGLIDKAKAGQGSAPAEVTRLVDAEPAAKTADLIVTLNLVRMATQTPQKGVDQTAPAMVIPTQSNLGALMSMDKGEADVGITVPKTHLQEMIQAMMMRQR